MERRPDEMNSITSETLDSFEHQATTSLKHWFECDAQTALQLIDLAREGLELGLSLNLLQEKNAERQKHWCPNEQPDLSFRGNELAGETGEACNIIKKLERERHGWRGSRSTVDALASEIADVVICASLVANAAGFNLSKAVQNKFNETSEKQGLPTRLEKI